MTAPQYTLDLTCSCGAKLHLDTQWGDTLRTERAAFDAAHATCRDGAHQTTPPSDHPTPMQVGPTDTPTTLGFTTPGLRNETEETDERLKRGAHR